MHGDGVFLSYSITLLIGDVVPRFSSFKLSRNALKRILLSITLQIQMMLNGVNMSAARWCRELMPPDEAYNSSGKHVRVLYTPLNPTFIYAATLGHAGIYLFFFYFYFFLFQNKDCGYSLEPHRRGGCNVYPRCMF